MVTEIFIILILIILNGILSASEIAIVSSRKARLQAASEKNAGAKTALELKDNPNNFLSTVQIGITLIGILTGFFSGGSISTFLAEQMNQVSFLAPYSSQIAVVVVVLTITYLSLVIGELVPKRIGMAIPEKYASFIAVPMNLLSKIVKPFVWLLSVSTDFIVKLFNIKSNQNAVTEEEIKALVDEGVDSGAIEGIEHDMVDRVLSLGDKRAINLMVHRSKITYLDIQKSFEENKAYILADEHTEYPVCNGNFDHVIGVVHIKTLFKEYLTSDEPELTNLLQPIPFINENTYAYNVMQSMKTSGVMQAVVVDEYGSPQGIITMADLVGSLVGGFDSPEDDEKKTIRQREDGSYVIDGSYQLDDFIELFNINLTEDDEDEIGNLTTVAGLVFLLLDHIPEEGEQVVYKNLEFEVLDMDGHRIDKLIVNVQGETSDETANID
ncbi:MULTISPECIES: hemolysin family protein [unclassified Sphingobacterium]|uniref:hemolysin family protein n=1 Tax=unclassified Sphingobacterium TaxID=2609468 RepID=UPI00265CB825|nr:MULTISPECIES: hemolysin family protein [unclassified Sphingobacterium]WKK60078.1 hemolysin family protein [Sphingobacterium sp. BN32]